VLNFSISLGENAYHGITMYPKKLRLSSLITNKCKENVEVQGQHVAVHLCVCVCVCHWG